MAESFIVELIDSKSPVKLFIDSHFDLNNRCSSQCAPVLLLSSNQVLFSSVLSRDLPQGVPHLLLHRNVSGSSVSDGPGLHPDLPQALVPTGEESGLLQR